MAKATRPKTLMGKGSTLMKSGAAAPKKSPLVAPSVPGQKKDYSKKKPLEQEFTIPGFGQTGLTGRS